MEIGLGFTSLGLAIDSPGGHRWWGSKIVGATTGGVHSPASLAHLLWKQAFGAPPKCSALT